MTISNRLNIRLSIWWLLAYTFSLLLTVTFLIQGAPASWQAWLYGIAVWLSYSLVYLLPAIALSYLLHRLLRPGWPILFWSLSVLLFGISFLLVFADGRLFGLFGFHINSFVINLVTTPGGIESLDSGRQADITFALIALGIILVPAFLLLPARWLSTRTQANRYLRIRTLIIVFAILAIGERLTYGVSALQFYSPVLKIADTFPFYNRITIKQLASRLRYENTRPQEIQTKVAEGNLNYPLNPVQLSPPDKPLNIVWLVAESLRWDMLTPEIMPHSWRFSQQSWRLEEHLSGGNGTRQGLFSLMYGLYGAYWDSFLRESRGPLLLDVLKQQHYQFYMATSASFTYPEFDRTLFAAIDSTDLHQAEMTHTPWKRDEHNAQAVSEFILTRDPARPFMSFFFLESTHARYDFPDSSVLRSPYLGEVNYALMSKQSLKKDIDQLKNRYINASHHVDLQISKILKTLEQQNLRDSTIVVITGDHGEEFMEKGHWGHNAGFHEEQIRTPMILHIPGTKPQVVKKLTSHMDIIPTLLPLFGVTNPVSEYAQGYPILMENRPNFVVTSDWSGIAYIDQNYKFYVPYRSVSSKQNVLNTRDDKAVQNPGVFYQTHMRAIREVLKGAKIFTETKVN